NSPAFERTASITFNTFAGITYAYVGDIGLIGSGSSHLWQCPMNNATGGFSGTCTDLTNTPPFAIPFSAAFNTFSGITYAYVADVSIIWQCPIDTATGGFSGACVALTNSPAFLNNSIATFHTF